MPKDRWLSIVLRTALLGLFLWMVRGLLIPIALGALFALLLAPFDRRLKPRLGKAAGFSSLLVTAGVLVLVVIPFVLITVQAVSSINDFLTRDWTLTIDKVQTFLSDQLDGYGRMLRLPGENIRATFQRLVGQVGTAIAGYAGAFATSLPSLLIRLFLFILALYYFLRDGRAISQWMHRMSPFPPDETEELFRSITETVKGAVLSLLATAGVQGGLTTIALYVFRVPGAFLFGIIATLLSVIPLVGTTPVTIGATIFLVASGRFGAAVGMAIAAVIVGFSDNIVRPWVQSSRTQMHPLLTILGIFGGLELFGPAGIFLGPVVAVMAFWTVDTYSHLRDQKVHHGGTEGTEKKL
jgi:predicted PurR-regulated permease PerM